MTTGERCNRIGQWGEVKRKLTNRERLGLGTNWEDVRSGITKREKEKERLLDRLVEIIWLPIIV